MGLLKAVAVTALLSVFAVIRLVSGPQPQSARRSVVEAVSPPRRQLFTRVFSADAADLNNTCGYEVQQAYGCSKPGCEDLAAGYINYIYFQECIVPSGAAQLFSGFLLAFWMLFLLHLVESTTNDYFCTSLQLVVGILKLSPNVAGVTFLAVGNAACDVIASIAAFATGVPKVGIGTTLGAGIFVTTAVVAAVSFVADVRLARRSFVRDLLFFIGTVVYLLYCTLDGVITLTESIGFMIIYVVFVALVAGGRFIRSMRSDEDGGSFGGSTGKEHVTGEAGEDGPPSPYLAESGSYQSPAASGRGGGGGGVNNAELEATRQGLLSALEAARKDAMTQSHQREIEALKREKTFRTTSAYPTLGVGLEALREGRDSSEDVGGETSPLHRGSEDLEGGVGEFSSGTQPRLARARSYVDDLPVKPSAWTNAFNATQEGVASSTAVEEGGGASSSSGGAAQQAQFGKKSGSSKKYEAYSMPTYHKRKLAKEMAARLAERGIHHMVRTEDGRTVDIAELAVTDPDAAADILSKAAAAITASAVKSGGGLTFQAAAAVARQSSGMLPPLSAEEAARTGGRVGDGVEAGEDLLAVLPKETIKPVADMYLRFKRVFGSVGPYYFTLMHALERPFIVGRYLTIPLLHPGAYRRRLIAINLPFSFALFTFVFTTHIIEGATSIAGVPFVAIAFGVGLLLMAVFLWALPSRSAGRKLSSTALLTAKKGPGGAAASSAEKQIDAAVEAASKEKEGGGGHGGHGASWYTPIVAYVTGPADEPLPTGYVFTAYLVLSFVMALFWLLLIANELVATALCFGKVLAIPDTVMGLVVLAVGNSINDLAASVTIAREGFPTMAVAGAYAGPMFNVLAGIGLPMLIYTSSGGDYAIGKDTPLVQAAFAVLLGSLTITLIWVPLAGFRITHRIGRFLMAWFFGFILLVIIMGSIPGLTGEGDVALSE